LDALLQEKNHFNNKLKEERDRTDSINKELQESRSQAERIQKQLNDLKANSGKSTDKRDEVERKFDRLTQDYNDKINELKKQEGELAVAKQNQQQLKQRIEQLNTTVNQINQNQKISQTTTVEYDSRIAELIKEKNELIEQIRSLYSTQDRLTKIINTQQTLLSQKETPGTQSGAQHLVPPIMKDVQSIIPSIQNIKMPVEKSLGPGPLSKYTLPKHAETKVVMIRPEYDYLILSMEDFDQVNEGSKLLLSKDGMPVYQVEIQSVDDTNLSTVKITKRLNSFLELSKGDICEATEIPATRT
jgi:uncharacterized phage infection (PIP) family protein YhgE